MSWFDAWLNGNVALSGWFPTIFIFLLGLFLGRKRIKDGWTVIKTKIHNSKNAEKENIVAMNAGSIGTVYNYFGQGLQNQMPNINQNSAVYSVVNKLVDENVTLISFNQEVHGNENDILNDFSYVVQQYLQMKNGYGFSQNDLANVKKINEKLESMLNQISAQFPQKFDECFVKLYTSVSWEAFLDEKFVEMASACYRNNWNDQNDFSLIVENILPKLQKTGDYNVENDCSRVLQIFWNSLNDDLRYKIAIAYYNIYNDDIWRQMKFPQKQFADKIYKELGWENIIKEMMRPILSGITSDDVEKVAEEYRLNVEWLKKQYDELHAKRDLDLDDFART